MDSARSKYIPPLPDPNSGRQKRMRQRQTTITALHEYLILYGGYGGSVDSFKKLLREAGVTLRRKRVQGAGRPRWMTLSRASVRKVLELHYKKLGAKELRKKR